MLDGMMDKMEGMMDKMPGSDKMQGMMDKMPGKGKKKEKNIGHSNVPGALAEVAQNSGGLGFVNTDAPVGVESGFAQVTFGGK